MRSGRETAEKQRYSVYDWTFPNKIHFYYEGAAKRFRIYMKVTNTFLTSKRDQAVDHVIEGLFYARLQPVTFLTRGYRVPLVVHIVGLELQILLACLQPIPFSRRCKSALSLHASMQLHTIRKSPLGPRGSSFGRWWTAGWFFRSEPWGAGRRRRHGVPASATLCSIVRHYTLLQSRLARSQPKGIHKDETAD